MNIHLAEYFGVHCHPLNGKQQLEAAWDLPIHFPESRAAYEISVRYKIYIFYQKTIKTFEVEISSCGVTDMLVV